MTQSDFFDRLKEVLGNERVVTGPGHLERYCVDAWPLAVKWAKMKKFPFRPDVAVLVSTANEVSSVLRLAHRHGVPVTTRGLGSSVVGQPLPTQGGMVLDMSLLVGNVEVDEFDLLVTTGAGRRGGDLESRLRAKGYTLGHSPQSLERSTVGGWLATRATGQFSSRYGGIEELVMGFKGVMANGDSFELSSIPRSAMGPDLRSLFVGAEGTLGVITEVTLRIFPVAKSRSIEAFAFASLDAGVEALRQVARVGVRPFVARLYDADESRDVLPDKAFDGCLLLTGCEGPATITAAEQKLVSSIAFAAGGSSLGSGPVELWLQRRFDFSRVEELLASAGGYAETIEVAHRWSRACELYHTLKHALSSCADRVVGHFSHIYPQGTSLYLILTGVADDDTKAAAAIDEIWRTAMVTTLGLGGVLSHHHGIGLARSPYLAKAMAGSFPLLQSVKDALDPKGLLNPEKLGLKTAVA